MDTLDRDPLGHPTERGKDKAPQKVEDGGPDFGPKIAELRGVGEGKQADIKDRIEEVRAAILGPESPATISGAVLTTKEQGELEGKIKDLKKEVGFRAPAIIKGNNTAAEYDCHVHSYSTQTKIVTLESGRKLFVVFNYPTSWIHRKFDNIFKTLSGRKIKKADSIKWKETFERRSQIPTINNSDPNTIVMDYLPNVNLYDLFANRSLIKDYGECDFAKDMDADGLMGVLDKVVDQTKAMHTQGVQWGELNLPNMIIDKDQNVHICDPETEYSPKVPVPERQARDLFIFLMSSSAALQHGNGVDHAVAIRRMLDRYQLGEETKKELKKLAEKPMSFLQKLTFGYTQVNYGLKDKAEYEKIKQDIASCLG